MEAHIMEATAPSHPLFIVGLPRSGTKLLRALLDNHSHIRLTQFETQFLPFWVRTWTQYGDLSNFGNFVRFYETTTKLPYFLYIKKRQSLISAEQWHRTCLDYTINGVFEALVRHDVSATMEESIIWGDKTPSYVLHVSLLKSLFPKAKFIHIIRDVRDYALSVRKTWGKNPYRAAQQWSDAIVAARQGVQSFPRDYFEIRYEDLLTDPEPQLRGVCEFLGLAYEPPMLRLTQPIEPIGAARGSKYILKDNIRKYETQMPNKVRGKIEAIAGQTAAIVGYQLPISMRPRHLSRTMLRAYQLVDGLQLIRSNVREKGLNFSIRYIIAALRLRKR